jgi:hypothetical protein
MRAVKGSARQSGVISVTLADLDLLQSVVGREMSRRFDETSAAIDPENRPGRADALAQKMQNAPRAASNIDDPLAGLDPDFFQLGVGIRRQISDLPSEALLLASAAPKQIKSGSGKSKPSSKNGANPLSFARFAH